MAWVAAIGAVILGAALLKAVFDSDAKIYRCPYCNLVLTRNTSVCPRCRNRIIW